MTLNVYKVNDKEGKYVGIGEKKEDDGSVSTVYLSLIHIYKRVEIPIPDNMKDRIDQHRAALCENIAELSEDLMERYLSLIHI